MLRLMRRRKEERRKRRWGEPAAVEHLSEFARSREGVEGFVEPRTMVTETTVVFVAASGEWTRRRVSGPGAAGELGRHLDVPIYDVQAVGYPERMRAYNRRTAPKKRLSDEDVDRLFEE